jgi:hypothetical protein
MRNMIIENLRDQGGNVLIVTMLILFAITIIGGTVASVSTMDLKISGNQRASMRSLFVAEAGLNEAIHRLSLPDPTVVTIGGWTGNAAISDSEPYDPNWTVRIYLTNPAAAPPGSGSVHTTGTVQDLSTDPLTYSVPDGTNDVLTIRHKWVDRNADGVRDQNEIVLYDALGVPPENFVTGNPVEVITVTGRASDGERIVRAEVTRMSVQVRTLGALYVDKAVKITGNSHFCGYNHSIDTPPFTVPNACSAWHLAGGSLPGVTSTGDMVKVMGSSNVKGYPIPVDNSPTNPFYSLPEVLGLSPVEVNEILDDADHTSIKHPLNGITFIKGDANINSNLTGEGLLYVTGDLHAAGSFTYKGLIFVEGDVHFTGTPWILGCMVVRGTSDFNFSSGNAAVLFSQEALERALDKAMSCMVLSWQMI